MAITGIQNITNLMADKILFVNTEFSGNNREIAARQTKSVGNAWVPWCTDDASFPAHHMQLIDTTTDKVFAYIWQHGTGQGDFVRFSPTGFEDEGAHLIKSGSTCNLVVLNDGSIQASDV